MPESIALAQQAFQTGRLREAKELLERQLLYTPRNREASLMLGLTLARLGEREEAISRLIWLIGEDPQCFEAYISLATLYRETRQFELAVEAAGQALELRPSDPSAHYTLGLIWVANLEPQKAAASLTKALQLQPTLAPAYYHLGRSYQNLGQFAEAIVAFEQAVQLAPRFESFLGLAKVRIEKSDFAGALTAASEAVKLNPQSPEAQLALADAFFGLKRPREAENHLAEAVRLDPEGYLSFEKGLTLRRAGRTDEANRSFRKAIEVHRDDVSAYGALVHNLKVTSEDRAIVDQMQELANDPRSTIHERRALQYAIAKSLEDLGEYEESMAHYDEANRLVFEARLRDAPFDREEFRAKIDWAIANCTPESLSNRSPKASQADLPIVICGVMRSGTTLAEQILSCHPKVWPAGEQSFWLHNYHRSWKVPQKQIVPARAAALGGEYVQMLQKLSGGAERVTDKMPDNYLVAGLVHLALPNARIIHMRRLPVDTAVSIWMTPNALTSTGGHQKDNIVFAIKESMRLIAHLREVLPPDRFLEVDYEDLVTDFEQVAREMVDFCGLPWDDACFQPQENKKVVQTPSTWQVRQSIYRSSVERWRNFQPWLGEFADLIDVRHPRSNRHAGFGQSEIPLEPCINRFPHLV